jgi:hypothetical protein
MDPSHGSDPVRSKQSTGTLLRDSRKAFYLEFRSCHPMPMFRPPLPTCSKSSLPIVRCPLLFIESSFSLSCPFHFNLDASVNHKVSTSNFNHLKTSLYQHAFPSSYPSGRGSDHQQPSADNQQTRAEKSNTSSRSSKIKTRKSGISTRDTEKNAGRQMQSFACCPG